jgi:hypothetical protein
MYNLLEPVELNRSYDQRIGKLQSSGAAAFSKHYWYDEKEPVKIREQLSPTLCD